MNDYAIRFRYLKYINNIFINQLIFIVESNEEYIDILNTQYKASYHNNDAIIINENKIIKIFTDNNKIIISIFQFYDYNTLLFIKIYNMYNYDQINYDSNINPSIIMIQNSLIICLSMKYKQKQNIGYFFLNNPEIKNITIYDNIINLNNIISKENIIYDLNIKLKILDFPDNFILYNNDKEIKKDDILDINSEIIIKQYKIDKEYIIKYKGIYYGNDKG